MNRTRVILVAAVVVGMLVGCAAQDAEPTPSPVAESPVETPAPEPTQPALADLVLSTEGLDYLLIGQPVPAVDEQLAIVAWDPAVCENDTIEGEPYAGAWLPAFPDEFPFVVDDTTGGLRDGDLVSILVPTPGISTSDGIAVGSTKAELDAAYPAFDEHVSHPEYDLYVIDGTAGQLVFDLSDGLVAAIQVTPVDEQPGSTRGGDASFPCV